MKPDALFITGTDTGIGKTVVTAAIALHLRERGLKVAAYKPVQTGIPSEDGQPSDAEILLQASSLSRIEEVCAYTLKHPLAPAVAAEIECVEIEPRRFIEDFRSLRQTNDVVLVEGVGGLMVPIRWDYSVADLIQDLGIPALIVARAGLGTINHTALTAQALQARGVEILGIVLNGQSAHPDLAERTNSEAVRRMTGVDRVVIFPHCAPQQLFSVALELQQHVGDIFSDEARD